MLLVALALAQQKPPAYDPSRTFAPLIESVAPAVVMVEDGSGDSKKAGSGFLASADGLVLTNHHVIEAFPAVRVRLQSGQVVQATVVGSDASMDIALLRIQGTHPWLALADDVRVGDRVLTLGSPLGLGVSATAGIISGKGRDLRQDRYYRSDDYLQTDAAINQGNSGGPLFDLDGRVVGMNTAIINNVNTVGFAIPSHQLAFAIREISEHGRVRRGFLGVKAATLKAKAAVARGIEGGAVVKEVVRASPAARAGLQPGDIVVRVGRVVVTNYGDFMVQIGNHKPGDEVVLDVLRIDERLPLTLTLGDLQ